MTTIFVKAPPISLTCGGVTLTWIDAEVSVCSTHSQMVAVPLGEDYPSPDYQEWGLPAKPGEWPAMEAEIAKGGDIVFEMTTQSSGRMSFVADRVWMAGAEIVVRHARPTGKSKA